MITVRVWGIPKAQGRPRARGYIKGRDPKTGKPAAKAHIYNPEISEDWKHLVMGQLLAHRPAAPIEGPVKLVLIFHMPIPKTMRKWEQRYVDSGLELAHSKRPDLDQLEKGVMDCLQNAGYYRDDAQVAHRGGTRKIYSRQPGVDITIEEIKI